VSASSQRGITWSERWRSCTWRAATALAHCCATSRRPMAAPAEPLQP